MLIAGAGCSPAKPDGVTPGVSDSDVIAKTRTSKASIEFATCSLVTGGDDDRGECVSLDVPLDWNNPNGARATFFVKRIVGSAPGTHKQLWLLQGGPGDAGDGLEGLASQVAANDPSLDIYIPDHRGTGRSTKLDCPMERQGLSFDYDACLTAMKTMWGLDGLATFSTTTAARDVGYVIEHTREKAQEVHVYGVSYGTYWAQRYLQLFPKQPTAVALDGVCQSGLCSYLKSGYWLDRVGKKYMAECAADATCGAMLGPDPTSKVEQAFYAASAGTCPGLKQIDGPALRRVFGWFITSFELRALIPAVTYRILRCDDGDVTALQHFETAMVTGAGADLTGVANTASLSSDMLGRNIAFSELEADPPPTRNELFSLMQGAVFSTYDPSILSEYDSWPRYARDEYVGQYPASSVPVLLMNGTMDPQTPEEFAESVAPHYAQDNQMLVLLPRASHAVVVQSPVLARVTSVATPPTCGMSLWRQFMGSPISPLDTSCRQNILGYDFAESQSLAATYFQTTTLWGNTTVAGPTPSKATATPGESSTFDAALQRAIQLAHPLLRARR